MSSVKSPHEPSQSGHGGGLRTIDRASGPSHGDGGGGGAGLRDESDIKDGSSIKAQIIIRGASSLLKTELISGSHGMFNLSI